MHPARRRSLVQRSVTLPDGTVATSKEFPWRTHVVAGRFADGWRVLAWTDKPEETLATHTKDQEHRHAAKLEPAAELRLIEIDPLPGASTIPAERPTTPALEGGVVDAPADEPSDEAVGLTERT